MLNRSEILAFVIFKERGKSKELGYRYPAGILEIIVKLAERGNESSLYRLQ